MITSTAIVQFGFCNGLLFLIFVLAQMGKVPHCIIDFYPLVLLATNIPFVFLVFAGDK